jgi:hypothetical protein
MAEQLPEPPVPPDCDLQRYRRMPIDIVKLRQSGLQMECSPEEKWFAFELWMAAFHQVPAGSLPDEEPKLAYMAGLARDKRTWNRVKKAALRGWVKHSDGRLYHPVLADICLEVWETMRARKRGARVTNNKRSEGQAIDKSQEQSGSAPRSIYNERDDQRADSERPAPRSAVATEGKDTPSPLPPTSVPAGSGCAEAAPARPPRPSPAKPAFTQDHGAEDAQGRVCVHFPEPIAGGVIEPGPKGRKPERLLWIDAFGNVDETTLARDAGPLSMTAEQALAFRTAAVKLRAVASEFDPVRGMPAGCQRANFPERPLEQKPEVAA